MNLSLNIRHLPLRSCTLLHPNGSFYRTLTARPIPDDSKSLRAAALKPKLLILCSVLGEIFVTTVQNNVSKNHLWNTNLPA